ncbi:MAG: hypothetical protein LC620_05660, partial [Halobacteriales archaeon]|nr:hypothetical protein [Halobacteriales archaeon]
MSPRVLSWVEPVILGNTHPAQATRPGWRGPLLVVAGLAVLAGTCAAATATVVAVGFNGAILASPDGLSWTTQPSGTGAGLLSVAAYGNQWVAVGSVGIVLTSPDGYSWSVLGSLTPQWLYGVATDGNVWVAVGGGGVIFRSTNGVAWFPQSSGTT